MFDEKNNNNNWETRGTRQIAATEDLHMIKQKRTGNIYIYTHEEEESRTYNLFYFFHIRKQKQKQK